MVAPKGLYHAAQDGSLLNILDCEHPAMNEARDHRAMFRQISDHFRPDTQQRRRASAGRFTSAIDAQQNRLLARQPQHVTVLGIVDTVVAIGQTAAERRHGQRSAAQFGDQLNERLFVHNATRQLLSARPKPVVAPAPSIMDWP